MTEALVLLVLVWAGVLLPGALRSRNASPHATIGGFERAMDVLRSDTRGQQGRQLLVPGDAGRIVEREVDQSYRPPVRRDEDPVVARRRAWFVRSLATTAGTLLLAVALGGWLWLPFALTLAFTAAYITVLRRLKLQRDEAREVVRELDLTHGRPAEDRYRAAVGETPLSSGTVRLRRWDD